MFSNKTKQQKVQALERHIRTLELQKELIIQKYVPADMRAYCHLMTSDEDMLEVAINHLKQKQ